MDLLFKDLNVNINKTPILKGVCGMVNRGEMLAAMGPSGAGKSTLLNALSGRCPLEDGLITLNNQPMTKLLKRKVAYVLQQDVFFSELTLRETLTYSAMLRLPDKMPHSLKIQRVEEIMEILELQKCSSTIMGSPMKQGLSGGEKKRASIAMELLTNPLVLLLDEPTSGLDYSIAYNLMKLLRDYTEKTNKTLVITIHQPSSQIYHMFHNLLLMVDGQVGYFGDASKVLDFFRGLGHHCGPHYNPADFMLEKCKESKEITEEILKTSETCREKDWPDQLRAHYVNKRKSNEENGLNQISIITDKVTLSPQGNNEVSGKYLGKYTMTTDSGSLDSGIDTGITAIQSSIIETDLHMETFVNRDSKWPTGFWTQYKVLTMRIFKHSKSRILSNVNIAQAVAVTFFSCIFWFQIDRSEETLRDRMGILFFASIFWAFVSCSNAISAFPEERPVIMRERSSHSYHLSAYYFAKMTSELPLNAFLPFIYVTIVYWAAGLTPTPGIFFAHLGTVIFFTITLQGFGIFMGCAINDFQKSLVTGLVFILISMLAGGFYASNFPFWAEWLKYLSIIAYVFNAVMILELEYGDPLECLPANKTFFSSCLEPNTTTVTGSEILEGLGITVPLWINYVVIVAFMISTRVLGYMMLRYVHKPHTVK